MSLTTSRSSHSIPATAVQWIHALLGGPAPLLPPQTEKRALPRHPLRLTLRVSGQTQAEMLAQTLDVSAEGLFIEMLQPAPPPGSILRLQLDAPRRGGSLEEIIGVVTRTTSGQTHGVGVQILEGISHPKALRLYKARLPQSTRRSNPALTH